MRLWRWLSSRVMRGPDAPFVRHDLDELHARDRADGLSSSRAGLRYARRLAASAFSLWRGASHAARTQPGGGTIQDLRFALRLFRRSPGPIVIAIGGLALAVGVAASIFTIVDATTLRPYGMADATSVVSVGRPGQQAWVGLPYSRFLGMREASTLATLEASLATRARIATTGPSSDGLANRGVMLVTGGYLPLLGALPLLGRSLQSADDRPGAPAVAVISHFFWTTALDSDGDIVGRSIWVNGAAVTVVGVLQPGFTGPTRDPQALWTPLATVADLGFGAPITPTDRRAVEVIGRLRPGVSAPAAALQLSAIADRDSAAHGTPRSDVTRSIVEVRRDASPLDEPGGDTRIIIAIVFVIIGLVIALACTNTANLLMASTMTRAREIAVRLAMGATRTRLVRQMINESVLLGLVAGACGFLFAFWLTPMLAAMTGLSLATDLTPTWHVLLFTLAVAFVCGIGAGVAPAWHGVRGRLLPALQSQNGTRGGAMRSRARVSFVGFQAMVSMLLLAIAALLARSASTLGGMDVGFDADQLIGVSFDAPRSAFDEPAYIRAAIGAVRDLPSVERASVSQFQPFGMSTGRIRLAAAGRSYQAYVNESDAAFFATAGIRVIRGRSFTPVEGASEAPVALVSDSLAKGLFVGKDAIGQPLMLPSLTANGLQESATIVGVVADALLTPVDDERFGAIYRPIRRQRSNPPTLLIRAALPGAAARGVEDAVRRIDPRVQASVEVIRDRVDSYLDGKRRMAWLVGPVAALALILAVIGVHGVTAFVVAQRTEEVSVRIAIGATSAQVMRLLVKDSLRPVVIGLVIGVGLALAVGRIAAHELGGISPHDPLAIGAAMVTLFGCALLAVILPARRAAQMDPATLVR